MLGLAARTAAFYAPRTASLRLVRHAASRAERELELLRKTVPQLKDELRAQGLKVGGRKAALSERCAQVRRPRRGLLQIRTA